MNRSRKPSKVALALGIGLLNLCFGALLPTAAIAGTCMTEDLLMVCEPVTTTLPRRAKGNDQNTKTIRSHATTARQTAKAGSKTRLAKSTGKRNKRILAAKQFAVKTPAKNEPKRETVTPPADRQQNVEPLDTTRISHLSKSQHN